MVGFIVIFRVGLRGTLFRAPTLRFDGSCRDIRDRPPAKCFRPAGTDPDLCGDGNPWPSVLSRPRRSDCALESPAFAFRKRPAASLESPTKAEHASVASISLSAFWTFCSLAIAAKVPLVFLLLVAIHSRFHAIPVDLLPAGVPCFEVQEWTQPTLDRSNALFILVRFLPLGTVLKLSR